MKLVVAVVQDRDTNELLRALVAAGYRATKLASTGGFLRGGNTTLMIGTEDAQVPEVMEIISHKCKARTELVTPASPAAATGEAYIPFPTEVTVGGATVFVLTVEEFAKY